jgi:DNA polymerase-3 subunit gamma/tau
MSYQVLARKWRPQRFDDVVGQQVVTRTLRNALSSGRLAQAFVFAGPRGVGKTTTARILARALSCVNGPTPDPCGVCDACVEIAEGRDIDVLEIDAATHTGVDNVREVIIAGLSISPVRNRYKVFVIDEVHQLSLPSFNALLKSIEEPPAHVIFMMATTELEKIPETVLSRSQVYELRAIGTAAIAEQLGRIAEAEQIAIDKDSLLLIARDADGSMRDAQSKLDQVIAFTGATVGAGDVAAVLGLVGRDLLVDAVQAVADEDAAAAFAQAGRAVELGYDLRLVCRELSRVVRDLLVLSIDQSRASDPEIAGEGERDRLLDLASRFSREDLLRAFDLLTKAESDIRSAAQPRYHLEMALLRWIYLRKLVPIEELAAGLERGAPPRAEIPAARPRLDAGRPVVKAPPLTAAPRPAAPVAAVPPAPAASRPLAPAPAAPPVPRAAAAPAPETRAAGAPGAGDSRSAPRKPGAAAVADAGRGGAAVDAKGPAAGSPSSPRDPGSFKDALLAQIRSSRGVFYNTVVAQAQSIDVAESRVTFTFGAQQRALRDMFELGRSWLEPLAQQIAGRRIAIASAQQDSPAPVAAADAPPPDSERKTALRERAMADEGVQALLEVFPAEIRDVEEM